MGDWVRYTGSSRPGWIGRVSHIYSKNGNVISADWVTKRGLWRPGWTTYADRYCERIVPTPEEEARWMLARIAN